ncbi:MAG: hypothetical protein II956_07215 [Bacteroidales bacterium]|nr:hypothetical protein [Bacteroidales bacterium]
MDAQVLAFDTVSLNIPKADWSFFKALVKKMGWEINKKSKPRKKRLYDPETGKYLNDETMKVIEDAENGIGLIKVGSMEEYLKLVENI